MGTKYSKTHMRSDEDYEEEETRRGLLPFVIMGIMVLGIIGIIAYSYIYKNTTYTSWEIISESEDPAEAEYMRCDAGYIRYNCDGATGYDTSSRAIWQISYNASEIIADTCGSFSVFADRGGQRVYISDGTGANYILAVPNKVEEVRVSEKGHVAVRTDSGLTDHIYLYALDGTMLLDIETTVKKSGFPITMALSPDGRKLVTSYLQIGEEQDNRVTFYNFGDVGQNHADKIVGSYSFGGSLVPDIRFTDDNHVCLVTDNKVVFYNYKEIPEEKATIDFAYGVTGISNDKKRVAVASKDSDGTGTISLYNVEGKLEASFVNNIAYDTFRLEGEEVLLTSGSTCVIYKSNGKEKLRMKMDALVNMMIPTSEKSTYTILEVGKAAKIRLKTASEEK